MLLDLILIFPRGYRDEALRSENSIPLGGEKSIGSKKYKTNWIVDDIYLK